MRELEPNEICGCGSGLTYVKCHKKTSKKYFIDKNGKYSLQVPYSPKLQESLTDSRKRFKKIFGRAPRNNEPIIFEKFRIGEETHFFDKALRAANSAGVDEALIYAWRKTEVIISEETLHLFTKEEKEEWGDAIAEYEEILDSGVNPLYIFTYLDSEEFESFLEMESVLKEIISVADLSLDKITNKINITSQKDKNLPILLSYNSVLHAIYTISNIIQERYSDDCLSIGRGIFEQYLRCKTLRVGTLDPEAILCASLASQGILEYARKKSGKIDYSRVINLDGSHVDVSLTYSSLAQKTGEPEDYIFYNIIYKNLSYYVHRDLSQKLINSLTKGRLQLTAEDDEIAGVYTISIIVFMFFEEILKNEWVPALARKDLTYKISQLEYNLSVISKNKNIRSGKVPLLFI